MVRETILLADVFREVLTYLGGRDDAVLFGAQAVNAYCETTRMTQDVDVLSTNAADLAAAVCARLAQRFPIAVRVREVVPGGFRVYQLRKPKNRHLVDVRQVDVLPAHERIEGVPVALPVELVVMKVLGLAARRGKEKGLSDRLDLHRLLNTFPDLRAPFGAVGQRLRDVGASPAELATWAEVVAERFDPDDDEGY
jgi:hypothetical protein